MAQRQGFFAKHGVAVNVTYTPNSVYMMTNLIVGKYDVAVSAVDALTTGFAFVLREMISRAGMTDADVTYVRTGGGPARARMLMEGKYAAGPLATPLDLIAAEKGMNRLGSARELPGRYQGRAAYSQRA